MVTKRFPVIPSLILALTILTGCLTYGAFNTQAFAINYSAGTYGSCTYNTCSISLTSNGIISVNVTPSASSPTCSVTSDSVTATTDSSTGYTITMTDSDTSNLMIGPAASTIAAGSGTPASPAVLTTNTWGYRVDSISGFGAGPTAVVTNGSIPSLTFAALPLSSGTPSLIRTTSTADTGSVSTPVWYGVCVNSSLTGGSYSDSVTYTALIN